MKKLKKKFAVLLACLPTLFGLAACDDATEAHRWDDGVVTTSPTCITPGVKTYTCSDCGETRKELLDADGESHLLRYESDETRHWATCKICGDVPEKQEHDYDDSDGEEKVCTVCGYRRPLTYDAYQVVFGTEHASIVVYRTQDYTAEGTQTDVAYSRDSESGKLLKNGEGQVNFLVLPDVGYGIVSVEVSGSYKNLKDSADTGVENLYRITKISGDLCVTVTTEKIFLNLPVIEIDTQNGAEITSKEDYVACVVSVTNTEEAYCLTEAAAGIRLRGNSTVGYPKKPYRIKFDQKTSLFGGGAYKSWVLLANYMDFSNLKDYAAFRLADSLGTGAFVPDATHVEVYLNGEYIGLYLLTEQVDENAGRTGVESDFDATATEIPFLAEWDEYAYAEGEENVDWFRIVNEDSGVTSYYEVKYPEADERYTQEQFDYIKNYIVAVNALCHSGTVTKEEFEEYVDLPAFIDYYLIQEVMGQCEINWKSVNMSKAIDGKLVMGPVWDFDWAAGGPMMNGGDAYYEDWYSSTNWFAYMLKIDWFQKEVVARWTEIVPALRQTAADLHNYKTVIQAASERNAILWDFDTDGSLMDFDEYFDWVLHYIGQRIDLISGLLGIEDGSEPENKAL